MKEEWFPRLAAAIKADGRSMRDISLAAGFGPNYIQQVLKDGKMPTAPKLFSVLDVLGPARTFFVLTGIEMRPDDEPLIREMLTLNPDLRRKLIDLVSSIPPKDA